MSRQEDSDNGLRYLVNVIDWIESLDVSKLPRICQTSIGMTKECCVVT